MKTGSLILVLCALAPVRVMAQDLFDRNRSSNDKAPVVRANPNGIEARIAPDFDYRPTVSASRVGGTVEFDYDFACGKFDLRSSLQHLLSREFRDEFVESLLSAGEGYLAGSALNLLCQSSPTLCNVFKHHRASANLLLGLGYDKCRAIEQALQNDNQRARARLIKECLERKLRENPNVPIDEAYEACLKSDEIRNFTGEFVKEINLAKDISKYFELEGEKKSDLERIFGAARVSPRGVDGQPSLLDAVGGMYAETKRGYLEAWAQAFRETASGKEPGDDLVKRLAPEAARLAPDDVRQINLLPDWKRDLLVRVLASLFAYYESIRRISAAESLLSELEAGGKAGAVAEKLARDRARLREERERLASEFEAARRIQEAVVAGRGEVEAHVAGVLQNKVGALGQRIESERIHKDLGTPWGRFKKPTPLSDAAKQPARQPCCSGQGNFSGGVYRK